MIDPFDSRATLTVLTLDPIMPRIDCDWCPAEFHYGAAIVHITMRHANLAEPSVAFACGPHYAEHFAGHKGEPRTPEGIRLHHAKHKDTRCAA